MAYERVSKEVVERVRDGAIHALDDLNLIIEEVEQNLEPADARELRRSMGAACSAILDVIQPLLRVHPECDLALPDWEEIGLQHRRRHQQR